LWDALLASSTQEPHTMNKYGTILDAIIAIAVFAGIGILLALGV
jgi:hypothetical protein